MRTLHCGSIVPWNNACNLKTKMADFNTMTGIERWHNTRIYRSRFCLCIFMFYFCCQFLSPLKCGKVVRRSKLPRPKIFLVRDKKCCFTYWRDPGNVEQKHWPSSGQEGFLYCPDRSRMYKDNLQRPKHENIFITSITRGRYNFLGLEKYIFTNFRFSSASFRILVRDFDQLSSSKPKIATPPG